MGIKIKGQYMNRSTFWTIKYMKGAIFSKGRYMKGVGFELLARTLVHMYHIYPQVTSYPPTREIYRSLIKHLRTVNEKYFRVDNCPDLG